MKTLKGKAGKINNLIVQRLWPLPFSGQMPLRVPFCASLALLKTAKVKGLEEGHGSLAEHEGSWTQEEPWQASPFHSLLLCSKNVSTGPVPILRGQVGVGTSCFLRFFLFLSCCFFFNLNDPLFWGPLVMWKILLPTSLFHDRSCISFNFVTRMNLIYGDRNQIVATFGVGTDLGEEARGNLGVLKMFKILI